MNHRDTESTEVLNGISSAVIGAAIEVHRGLGPGLLESIYEEALCVELKIRGIFFERQVSIPLIYKGESLEQSFRLDLLVESKLILELKAVSILEKIHEAQLISYLKLAHLQLGLLINFNVPVLKDGIKRLRHG
jgi:GxxExxY protein